VAPLERKKKPIVIIDNGLICLWKKKLKRKIMTMGWILA
jgi:hypothetical protein